MTNILSQNRTLSYFAGRHNRGRLLQGADKAPGVFGGLPMHAKNLWISGLTATLVIAFLPSRALAGADSWPRRTVRVIVPFAAGSDPAPRALAGPPAQRWKQPVGFQYRSGGPGKDGGSPAPPPQDD